MATITEVFQRYLPEYLKASKVRKQAILDTVCELTSYHRKAAIRKLRTIQMKSAHVIDGRGRKAFYTKDADAALFDVWEVANHPCGENLHPMVREYVDGHKILNRWQHTPEATEKLLTMSKATLKRHTKALRLKYGVNHGKSSTKPSDLKNIIPIFKGPWDKLEPGNGQLDTVAHCGNTLLGDFAYTVSYIDAVIYWGIRRAQWNKGQTATKNNLIVFKERLPFRWIMGHPDSGSEFINWVAKEWCDQNGIKLTRSEPNRKNDNMYIEERNGHVVRKYLGWLRLDADPAIVKLMNEYYEILDLYLNHFQAVRRTMSKERINSKYKRVFEKIAKTPYQRLLEHNNISNEIKEKIKREHESLNPLLLKEKLDILKKKIFDFQRIHTISFNPNQQLR